MIKYARVYPNNAEFLVAVLKQLGVTWISSADATGETSTVEGFTRIRQQRESGGFKVYNESSRVGPRGAIINVPEVVLNLPGRDEQIEEYLNYTRFLGKTGILPVVLPRTTKEPAQELADFRQSFLLRLCLSICAF